jgi:hypothetical protein
MADRRGSQRANPFFSGETKSSGRPCESGTVGSRSTDHQKQNEKDANGWHMTSDLRTMQRASQRRWREHLAEIRWIVLVVEKKCISILNIGKLKANPRLAATNSAAAITVRLMRKNQHSNCGEPLVLLQDNCPARKQFRRARKSAAPELGKRPSDWKASSIFQ